MTPTFLSVNAATHVFFGLVLTAALALGQLSTGTISGRILDPDGAGVPPAKLQLVEQQTGARRTAASDESGFYLFPLVPVGIYSTLLKPPDSRLPS